MKIVEVNPDTYLHTKLVTIGSVTIAVNVGKNKTVAALDMPSEEQVADSYRKLVSNMKDETKTEGGNI